MCVRPKIGKEKFLRSRSLLHCRELVDVFINQSAIQIPTGFRKEEMYEYDTEAL
jgi:hypothetical protein